MCMCLNTKTENQNVDRSMKMYSFILHLVE